MYAGIALYVFLLPAGEIVRNIMEPGFRDGTIPPLAWKLSRTLAPEYAAWAESRVRHPHTPDNVSGTEWPLFGSVFYLSALESLQTAWQQNGAVSTQSPAVYSRRAIEAAVNLVTDPKQAGWVQQYWGPSYLRQSDVFYRYLLISSMASYAELTGNARFNDQLREQVETLSAELDHSPYGLLDDYPGQCYPTDVISSLGAIKRADSVLHSDHSRMIAKALRALVEPTADNHGLPPFQAVSSTGRLMQTARGCGNSFAFAATPDLWPGQSAVWYRAYLRYFWQRRHGLVGFREFANDIPTREEFMDVDSGPVLLDYGVAASAFGVATTRAQGDLMRAAPLTAEMLVASWPLPDGTLLFPRLLSNATDAPYVGEAGVLYCLTKQVPKGAKVATAVTTPFVWLALGIYLFLGVLFISPTMVLLKEFRQRGAE